MRKRVGLRQIIRLYSNWYAVTEVRITYTQRSDATVQGELGALAAVYAAILRKHKERQGATRPSDPDDARKEKDARTYSHYR
jgi:hypothetical protein